MHTGERRRRAGPTVAAFLLALAAPLGAAPPADDFLALVTQARHGNVEHAVSTLLSWSDDQVVAIASAELENCQGACLRGAALLFTEIGVLRKLGAGRQTQDAPRKAAERILKSLHDDAFGCRQRLAIGYWYQRWGKLTEALVQYEKCGESPESLVAQGSVYEQIDAMGTAWSGVPENTPALAMAADRYGKALVAQPNSAEARLRLGRVLQRRGQTDSARERLTAVATDEAVPAAVRGYAHLFLGEMEQNDGHLEPAIAHFQQAIAADPRLQPAHLSLSQALHQAGRVREASAVLLDGLRATGSGTVHGWYTYHASALHGYRQTMDALWAEVRE